MRDLLRKLFGYLSEIPNERVLTDKAKVEGALPHAKIYWIPKPGVTHCDDCLVLAVDSPYTKETLPCYPGDGTTKCGKHCQCKLLIRVYVKKEETSEWPGPLHPLNTNRQPRPDLYGKFKGDVPEFRFFLDKHIGDQRAAKKEFEAAVNAAGVGFTGSNYDDPHNPRFFKSNKLWLEIEKVEKAEKRADANGLQSMSPERKALRKKRQQMMQDLMALNKNLEKDGLRWIRPDGYGGYRVGHDGRPSRLFLASVCQRIAAITITDVIIIVGVIVVLGIYAIILTKEKRIDVPAHNEKGEYHTNQLPIKHAKQIESPVDKKGVTLPDKKTRNAYEVLTPRMKEKVRLKVLKDFGKHPEKYRIENGTIHLR